MIFKQSNIPIRFILLLILVSCFNFTSGQINILSEKNLKADFFRVDKLGNFYFVTEGSVEKYNNTFEKIAESNNNLLGTISELDVTNPFRIMLYYSDFNKIVFLDSQLAELRSAISLDDLDIFDAGAVSYSSRGGFWVFRTQSSQVVNYSQGLQEMQKGTALGYAGAGQNPLKMLETPRHIIIAFEDNQVFILDNFGTFYKKINTGEIIDLTVSDFSIYILERNVLNIINVNTLITKNFTLPEEYKFKSIQVRGNKIIGLTDKSLITFSTD
jgi:hypothetical protein